LIPAKLPARRRAVEIKTSELRIGDRIRVVDGPYRGMRGCYGGQRVGRYLCVELEVWGRVEPLRAFVIRVKRLR
jgi:hypothetical protein